MSYKVHFIHLQVFFEEQCNDFWFNSNKNEEIERTIASDISLQNFNLEMHFEIL